MSNTEDNQLYQMLGRMEGKLDAVVKSQTLAADRARDLEVRIRGLEAFRSRAVGIAGVISAAGISFLTYMYSLISGGNST